MHKKKRRPTYRKIVLKLPYLDHAKSAVLNSPRSYHSRSNYKFAMEQFINWYRCGPRLTLNRKEVLRFRLSIESLCLAAETVNQRLVAVTRPAYEAADSCLLSPEQSNATDCDTLCDRDDQRSFHFTTDRKRQGSLPLQTSLR